MCTLYSLYYARHFVCSWILDTVYKECEVCVCASHTTPKPCCLLKVEIDVHIVYFIFIYMELHLFILFVEVFTYMLYNVPHTSLFRVSYRYRPLSDTTYYP